ncbi:uncharacterized protein LOC131153209 [Malania oleifera]|uniref:uncharacterized protein LOC131153209 n=1 Tax=Malania oleifera TaxID=397392 RepID=UPI0025AE347A|nr:uncharacterized protein LOC131153209 [Malania oleifera]
MNPKMDAAAGSGLKKPKSLLLPQTSLACVESLSMPLVQEVVLSADFQCAECRKRISDIMSKMAEMESIEVSVVGKKVTLTCRYPSVVKAPTPLSKVAMIARLFRRKHPYWD